MSNPNKIQPPGRKEKFAIRILIVLGLLSLINFFYWFLNPELIDNQLIYWLLMGPLVFDSIRIIYIWYHYWDISVPVKPKTEKKPTVDIFTTYFPGEPYEMVKDTLLAIQKMKYPHTTYLCDEANDPLLKEFCVSNGIRHVTRNNRKDAKAGNINNALLQATGEICLILDPDHIPKENFLDEIIPYFEDEQIGFVQSVQAYYNIGESCVAKGAAEQTFHFYGPIMMTMNSYGTVNAIGANCVFRRKALDSIGGHAPGLSEDMHTTMQLYAKGWKSVYVPGIFTKGLVPSSLTSYYKQQLKWSRGTLELLVSVYPKLFRDFSWRQKIHFGILPLHYLSGIIYFISFLIPIISLFFATTPWKGNIINFGLIVLPLFTCILGIRFYVQRWVTDKSERGTHVIGGILQACTWWIFIIGFIYTVFRKKVPYLPTPKEDKDLTSWKILVPNLIVGSLSVIAVIYGLSVDFTPFSMVMSGFALLNASFMFYTLYFAYQKQKVVQFSFEFRPQPNSLVNRVKGFAYSIWHMAALPLIITILLFLGNLHYQTEYIKWGGVKPDVQYKNLISYIGVFAPQVDDGKSNLRNVNDASAQINEKFDIISIYMSWIKKNETDFPALLLDSIYNEKSIPMITWEPWLTSFGGEVNGKHVFDLISDGYFDNYIASFAVKLKNLKRPVFLRFAHEYDNPFYPWYSNDINASEKFKKAWVHTYEIFKNVEAYNVIWVWNPWKSENIASYYPGKEYVDWFGVNVLNYGQWNEEGEWLDFKSLYEPFHTEFANLPATPVMISEFGSLRSEKNQKEWINDAFISIQENYKEIKSVIYFNSKVDDNWPSGLQLFHDLDWTISENQTIKNSFRVKKVPDYIFSPFPVIKTVEKKDATLNHPVLNPINGINLKISHDWRKDYNVLSRRNLISEFEKIKHLGINTIKFDGNSIYSYNLMNVSNDFGLKVAFGFWVPAYLDFIEDTLQTSELKLSILKKIKSQKNNPQITSWNIQNDVQYNQKDFFLKPRLFYQNIGYIKWLNSLVKEIKKIDSSRPVFVDLEVNQLSGYHAKNLVEKVTGLDALGLVVKEDKYLDSLINQLNRSGTDFLFSEIEVNALIKNEFQKIKSSFFITSWKDKHESNKLTFDGITDRKGRYRTDYFNLLNALKDSGYTITDLKAGIIKPAVPLHYRSLLDFYAMVYDENEGWKYGEVRKELKFEWSLIRCDNYGNYLAIKDIGKGPKLTLEIPKNPEYYKLLLTTINGKTISSTVSTLNTPVVQKIEEIVGL